MWIGLQLNLACRMDILRLTECLSQINVWRWDARLSGNGRICGTHIIDPDQSSLGESTLFPNPSLESFVSASQAWRRLDTDGGTKAVRRPCRLQEAVLESPLSSCQTVSRRTRRALTSYRFRDIFFVLALLRWTRVAYFQLRGVGITDTVMVFSPSRGFSR